MFNKLYEKLKKFIVNNYKFILSLLIVFIFCFAEIPYVIYTPGGVVPLENRIKIENKNDSKGSMNMCYVKMLKGRLPLVLTSFIAKDWDLVKSKDVTLEGENIDEMIKMDQIYMKTSIDNAVQVAYMKSGNEFKITKIDNNIIYIDKNAKTDIKKYDKILKVDGIPIKNIIEIKDILKTKKEGNYVNVLVNRNGKIINTKAKLYNTSDGLKMGIVFLPTFEYQTNPKVEIKTKEKESGPSGGLMLSLAIYNSLVQEDITKGDKIVGTGTIDASGNVGEIDGVKYKILGAKKNKADVFICPIENFNEVKHLKEKYNLKMEIKGVKTFDEALEFLKNRK